MDYLEYTFTGIIDETKWEILVALLDAQGYEGFVQNDEQMLAYISENQKDELSLHEVLSVVQDNIQYSCALIPETNWNAKWEQDFRPVVLNKDVIVRASFHERGHDYKYDILIDPKMSFGTGHHATTRLMMRAILAADIKGKTVLDMGCGTGVLAILGSMMGAKEVMAIDIDEWAYNNAIENVLLNKLNNVQVYRGDVRLIEDKSFQMILANINRNVLLEDLKHYYKALQDQGDLIISGILDQDESVILSTAEEVGFRPIRVWKEHNWLSIVLSKTDSHEETTNS